jgi:hypothetical protein
MTCSAKKRKRFALSIAEKATPLPNQTQLFYALYFRWEFPSSPHLFKFSPHACAWAIKLQTD